MTRGLDPRSVAGAPGSGVSPGRLSQDGDIKGLVCHKLLQLTVLFLKMLQALGLIDAQAAVLLLPAVVGLLGDLELSTDIGDRFPLGQQDLGLTQLDDDLFGVKSFLGHQIVPFLGPAETNFKTGPVLGGQVKQALEFLTASLPKGTKFIIEWIVGDPYLDLIRDLPEFREAISKYSV